MTDRKIIKDQQEGVFVTAASISDPHGAVRALHSKCHNFLKTGTENAATNVAESPMFYVARKSKVRAVAILAAANVANDTTDYTVFNFYKRNNGTSTLVASWNTHTSAQGALTTANAGVVANSTTGLVINSDAEIAAGSFCTYDVKKYGNGKAITTLTTFTVDLEEI